MNEADIRVKLQKTLVAHGFEVYHPPDIRETETARPDILSVSGFVIECKKLEDKERIEPWFNPKDISNGQRKHLDYYFYSRKIPSFLAIGTVFAPYRIWVVPWTRWDDLEQGLSNCGKDLSFRITLSNLEEYFPTYELLGTSGKAWKDKTFSFPAWHPILLIPTRPRGKKEDEWAIRSIRFPEKEKPK